MSKILGIVAGVAVTIGVCIWYLVSGDQIDDLSEQPVAAPTATASQSHSADDGHNHLEEHPNLPNGLPGADESPIPSDQPQITDVQPTQAQQRAAATAGEFLQAYNGYLNYGGVAEWKQAMQRTATQRFLAEMGDTPPVNQDIIATAQRMKLDLEVETDCNVNLPGTTPTQTVVDCTYAISTVDADGNPVRATDIPTLWPYQGTTLVTSVVLTPQGGAWLADSLQVAG